MERQEVLSVRPSYLGEQNIKIQDFTPELPSSEFVQPLSSAKASRCLGRQRTSKNVKLHVNDPEIGEKVSDYQKLFSEIFGGK
jgi:hypothetical protein